MDAQGTVVVRLSTSSARIPLQGATVTITKRLPGSKTQLLAVRVTNFDGLTDPVAIETPPMAESRSYQNTSVPYALSLIHICLTIYLPTFFTPFCCFVFFSARSAGNRRIRVFCLL